MNSRREPARRLEVVEVVERQLPSVHLLDAGEQVAARAALGVEGAALVGVLAVGEVGDLVEGERQRLREGIPVGEPAGDRGLVRGARRERLGREATAGLARQLPTLPELGEQGLVLFRPAHGRHVREVLRRPSQHRRAADVDHLDSLFLAHAVPPGHALEGIEADADEVEALDAALVERGHILLVVGAREDSRVDPGVERLHAAAQ